MPRTHYNLPPSSSARTWTIEVRVTPPRKGISPSVTRRLLRALFADLEGHSLRGRKTAPLRRIQKEGVSHLSVLLTNDKYIRELNREFRGKDKPTDVLSFAALERVSSEDASLRLPSPTLGDLVISLQTARRQARQYGWSLRDEFLRLLIHGLLHLLGYDHERVPPARAQAMRRLERELFKRHRPLLKPARRMGTKQNGA